MEIEMRCTNDVDWNDVFLILLSFGELLLLMLTNQTTLTSYFLTAIFDNFDRCLYRCVTMRMAVGFKKEIDGRSRMWVGNLSDGQWKEYCRQKRVALDHALKHFY
mmetsp:Transcript_115576/g.172713  ORF Transcript_115576/g.172713 Transcript_115576/m.172713 type:complete len:105 (-) Transcript_115576:3-317(-)